VKLAEYVGLAKPILRAGMRQQLSEKKKILVVCVAIGFLFNFVPKFAFYIDGKYDSLNYFFVIVLLSILTAGCFFIFALLWLGGGIVLHAGYIFLFNQKHLSKNGAPGLSLVLSSPPILLNICVFIVSALVAGLIYYTLEPVVVDAVGNGKTHYILRQHLQQVYN
jgi:hypothetical protein